MTFLILTDIIDPKWNKLKNNKNKYNFLYCIWGWNETIVIQSQHIL